MPIGLSDDDRALADTTAALCRRHAPLAETRLRLDDLVAGKPGPAWTALVDHGLHALHLPEEVGGGGAGLPELAVVAEQLGELLTPGPWLPTVAVSAALAASNARDLVGRLVDGATACLVRDGLTAERVEKGWALRGSSDPTLGLPGADLVVVRAQSVDGTVWLALPHGVGTVETSESVDLTRAVGRLSVDGVVAGAVVLVGIDDAYVDLVVATLLGAEAAGVARWGLETALAHLRTREQFGRPIGAFQALQHRAAMMLVRQESAVAAAWDAGRSATQSRHQQRIGAAQALVTCLPAAVDNVFDLISMLGAVGITWEHDAHLYWRRAVGVLGLLGDTASVARTLGNLVGEERRATGLDDPAVRPELRSTVGAVLDRVLQLPEEESQGGAWGMWTGGSRQDLLADHHLIAPHLPPPYGLGASPEEQAVIADEFARRDLGIPTLIVGDWFLVTLVTHGSPQQQARFAEPSLRGQIIWCQLFSEPGAGSDLASLSTRAIRVDGGWVLRGQKAWNSRACEAHWGVCLARTDPDVPKHKGLTYFLVDMSSAGVDARSVTGVQGQHELAEVWLDDVFVPDDCVIGQPNDGWRVGVATLSNERMTMGSRLQYGESTRLAELAATLGQVDPARAGDVARVAGECAAREIALAALNLRTVRGIETGRDMSAAMSVNKVLSAIAQRDGSRALLGVLGPLGATTDGGFVGEYLGMPALLFGGGTLEVQLNVIATRLLGLPRG